MLHDGNAVSVRVLVRGDDSGAVVRHAVELGSEVLVGDVYLLACGDLVRDIVLVLRHLPLHCRDLLLQVRDIVLVLRHLPLHCQYFLPILLDLSVVVSG